MGDNMYLDDKDVFGIFSAFNSGFNALKNYGIINEYICTFKENNIVFKFKC